MSSRELACGCSEAKLGGGAGAASALFTALLVVLVLLIAAAAAGWLRFPFGGTVELHLPPLKAGGAGATFDVPFRGAVGLRPRLVSGKRAGFDASPDALFNDAPLGTRGGPRYQGPGLLAADPSGLTDERARQRRSVYAAVAHPFSTRDVDPMVTGQIYAGMENTANIYAERTSHGDQHGLTEFAADSGPNEVGVDIGPFGLSGYEGSHEAATTYDDGVPEQWSLASTPVEWYRPRMRDYLSPDGPKVERLGLFLLSEPDHQPMLA